VADADADAVMDADVEAGAVDVEIGVVMDRREGEMTMSLLALTAL
jgi:hypothetical protein